MAMKQLLAMSAIGASLALAGCAAIADEPGETDECGAGALQGRIGEPVTGTNSDGFQISDEPIPVPQGGIRVVGPNDAMTMDFRLDRLTIETDEDGNLVTARCV